MDKSLTDVRDLIQNNSHLYDFAADFAAVCASAASLDFENLGFFFSWNDAIIGICECLSQFHSLSSQLVSFDNAL